MSGIALYGRTYLDAEVEIPLELLATGKGKVDVEVRTVLGGFPCNAARAVAGRVRAEDMAVVTRISALDLARLRAALPPGTTIRAIASDDDLEWPPVTVIVNPARECRLLRSGRPGDLRAADLDPLPRADLHVFGRVDHSLVDDVRNADERALLAWCAGGVGDTPAVHRCDLACVNTTEARALIGSDTASTRELAIALAERGGSRCVRVVTGRGDAPSVAAVRGDAGVRCFESAPAPLPREQIRRLKGVGDVFAARFFVEAVFDERGQRRDELTVERALEIAQAAAARFMTEMHAL
jgi:hypothetical protein